VAKSCLGLYCVFGFAGNKAEAGCRTPRISFREGDAVDIRMIFCRRSKTAKRAMTIAGGVLAAAVVAGVAVNLKSIKRYVKITFFM